MTPNLPPERDQAPLSAEVELDATIRALARETYHPPGPVPRDAMWEAIQSRRAAAEDVQPGNAGAFTPGPFTVHSSPHTRFRARWPRVAGVVAAMAATLFVGVVVGRSTSVLGERAAAVTAGSGTAGSGTAGSGTAGTAESEAGDASLQPLLHQLTSEHWSQSEALLVTAAAGTADAPDGTGAMVESWARDLLATTRLLLDTESVTDTRTRRLLQDLELTLALIAQAQASGRSSDLQAMRADLTSGDLLLRVRGAGAPADPIPSNSQGVFE